jgi:hypothetical protein
LPLHPIFTSNFTSASLPFMRESRLTQCCRHAGGKRRIEVKINYATPAGIFGVLAFALSLAPNCAAQCMAGFGRPIPSHTSWHSLPGQIRFMPAAFVTNDDGDNNDASIVGFWHQKLVIPGTNGAQDTVVDDGLSQWHSDGTEILNSGSQPTVSGNFCLGVWKKTGPRTYKLNHFPLSFDPTGTMYLGPLNLRAEVTVSADGNRYSGTFTLDTYDQTGKTKTSSVQGVITGTRITVDSPPPQNISGPNN